MKCLKISHRPSIYSLLFLPILFFLSLFGLSLDSYAVEDIKVTFNQYTGSYSFCNSQTCSLDYKYLIIESHNIVSSNAWAFNNQAININFYWDNSYNTNIGLRGLPTSAVFEINSGSSTPPSSLSAVDLSTFPNQSALNTLSPGWSIDITLSENNPYANGIVPSGSLLITENGTYDVTNYSEAVVDVSQSSGGGGGDYSQQLDGVITAIYTCGAIILVIYFFYCIYGMIIKSTGGK